MAASLFITASPLDYYRTVCTERTQFKGKNTSTHGFKKNKTGITTTLFLFFLFFAKFSARTEMSPFCYTVFVYINPHHPPANCNSIRLCTCGYQITLCHVKNRWWQQHDTLTSNWGSCEPSQTSHLLDDWITTANQEADHICIVVHPPMYVSTWMDCIYASHSMQRKNRVQLQLWDKVYSDIHHQVHLSVLPHSTIAILTVCQHM